VLFSSATFIYLFLPLALFGFHLLQRRFGLTAAALWLTIASVAFYGYWNIADVPLLVGSTLVNFGIGLLLQRRRGAAQLLLAAGVAGNLLLLGYYKYAAFFCGAVAEAGSCTGLPGDLPLAISFFTFTQIAFLVDVHRGQVQDRDPLRYGLFVTFFPHLIAGPIVHYRDVGPQLADRAAFRITSESLALGGSLFVAGLFKKVVLADRLASIATPIFQAADAGTIISTATAWTGALAYTLQLYFDFSGYSDMAIGLALMFGIRFPANFHSPYKATSLIDFWRRWHITLSLFLRDYLYIPLGGNRHGPVRRYVNLLVTMLLGGLWHGANWTFLLWGLLHGIGLTVNHLWRGLAPAGWQGMQTRPAARAVAWLATMTFAVVCWVSFRAGSLDAAGSLYAAMAGLSAGDPDAVPMEARHILLLVIAMLVCLLLPNTNQVFGIAVRGIRLQAPWPPLVFDYRLADFLVMAGMMLASLYYLLINAPSEFLYFDF